MGRNPVPWYTDLYHTHEELVTIADESTGTLFVRQWMHRDGGREVRLRIGDRDQARLLAKALEAWANE